MKDPLYVRNRATIITLPVPATDDSPGSPSESKTFGSVNAAKRESRRLQLEHDGALGRGSLTVGRA